MGVPVNDQPVGVHCAVRVVPLRWLKPVLQLHEAVAPVVVVGAFTVVLATDGGVPQSSG
jgi:hypothetical protein